jgi:choline kinase
MKKSLVILAAGKGSRYGGVKQMAVIINDYTLLDFNLYAATIAGFNHFIFVISADIEPAITQHWTNKLPATCEVDFIIQNENPYILQERTISQQAAKGTAYALLCAAHLLNQPFAVINADDLYGINSFKLLHDALYNAKQNVAVLYKLANTLSNQGGVNRGQCEVLNYKLQSITEHNYHITNNNIINELNEVVSGNELVSLNLWGFQKSAITHLITLFRHFENNPEGEFQLPHFVSFCQANNNTFDVYITNDTWIGLTYKEDLPLLKRTFETFLMQKVYPKILWK